jgi:hypothetical protein
MIYFGEIPNACFFKSCLLSLTLLSPLFVLQVALLRSRTFGVVDDDIRKGQVLSRLCPVTVCLCSSLRCPLLLWIGPKKRRYSRPSMWLWANRRSGHLSATGRIVACPSESSTVTVLLEISMPKVFIITIINIRLSLSIQEQQVPLHTRTK